MKQQTRWVNALLIVALLMAWPGNAVMAQTPVGAAFTYQGRLLDSSNVPVSGLCDMSFTLYDEESGGAQIGATQMITDVVMSDGYFSAALDFGAPAWNGDMRWLQVEATCPPSGSLTGFQRQVVRAVPYAMYALSGNAITSTVYVTETVYFTPSYHLQGWETITGTPSTYTPTTHTQDWATITDQPAEYTPTYHLQGWDTITGTPASYTPMLHDMITAHTYSGGAELDVFGLSAASTITRITPSNDPGATARILASSSNGRLQLDNFALSNYADFINTSSPALPLSGTMRVYGSDDSGFNVLQTLDSTGREFRIGQDTYRIARNTTGSMITKGQVVYYSGSTGNKPNLGLARSNSNTTMPAVAIAVANIANGAFGTVLVVGRLTGINTSAFTEGDPLYVSSTIAGALTNVSPIHPNYSQAIATVEVSGVGNGAILVNISPHLKGEESGTRHSNFTIGNQAAGPNTLTFDNGVLGRLTWNPTAARMITLPNSSGIVALVGESYTPTYHLQGWDTITGTPSTYTPTAHTQDWTTITGQPSTYTPTAHTQDWTTITGTPTGLITGSGVSGAIAQWATPNELQASNLYKIGSGDLTLDTFGNTRVELLGGGTQSSLSLPNSPIQFSTNRLLVSGGGLQNEVVFPNAKLSFLSGGALDLGGYTLTMPISWNTITGQPSEYTPTLGAHTWTGLQTFNAGASAASGQFINALTDGSTGGIRAGASSDVLLYRNAADTWRTPDSMIVDGNVGIGRTNLWVPLHVSHGYAKTDTSERDTAFLGSNEAYAAHPFGLRINVVGAANLSNRKVYIGTMDDAVAWGGSLILQPYASGHVGIGTNTPNTFILQVAGSVGPDAANTYDLGSAANYWATIHYHTLTSHSLSVFSTTVTLQNGRDVSCLDALKEIKADKSKKVKGIQHMDYATIPAVALDAAPMVYHSSTMPEKNGEDGADLDMMVSLMLCAEKELDAKNVALDNRMSDLEKRIANLERIVR